MLHKFRRRANTAHTPPPRRKATNGRSRLGRSGRLVFEPLEPRLVLDGGPLISEFMAINNSGLQDFQGDRPDWLEIHNPGTEAVDLTDWKLRDDNNEWVFPAMSLGPGEFRVIFASGKDLSNPAGELHTNFALKGDGEYLGLLDDTGAVIHEYDPYPAQTADVSYGIAQNVERTDFVSTGDTAKYLVPSGAPGAWTTLGFDDNGWSTGDTAIGYADTVPGFAVWNYKASVTVGNLGTALQVIDNPGMQTNVWSENRGVINYFNTGGHGQYPAGEVDFPGLIGDTEDFVVEATAFVSIPSPGQWTFGVNSDDGFQLTIPGTTTSSVTNSSVPAGSDTISYVDPRGPADTLGVFDVSQPGVYELQLVFYERGGGAGLELFAAQGTYAGFDGGAFDLVGDTANGGLEVFSEPVTGGGGGSEFAGLIETDVEDEMKGVNASLLARLAFPVTDPAAITSLTLKMKYDDGYVAYLNGTEIARRNAPATPTWNSHATDERTDVQATTWENVDVSDHLFVLGAGTNVLAVHGLNYTAGDGDFLILPELAQIRYLGLGEHFFAIATPGDANTDEYWMRVADTQFSSDRGFYDEPINLAISTDTLGAEIYYTNDGSEPSQTNGTLYATPIRIATTTTVRAVAFAPNYAPTNVDTHTYIFLDDVVEQPGDPAGFPASWNGTTADYEMDPDVVDNPLYTDQMRDSLRSIPTVSIVTDVDNLFGPSGIYSNPGGEGIGWERPTSVEWINPDGTTGFQVDAGLRIYGGAFRGMNLTRKKTFRLLFKDDYGPTKLDFPMFDAAGAAESFDTLILRAGANDAWNNWGGANTQYIVDEYMRRTQLALGGASPHGTFVHLYLNGLYWGLYNPVERPEASFCATYFGGDKADWDALNSGAPTGASNTASWNAMLSQAQAGLSDMASYQRIQGNNPDGTNNPAYDDLLDVDNYIDYMFSNFWGGTGDWPWHNWYVGCRRPPEATGFKFFNWDSEGAIVIWSNLNADVTGVTDGTAVPYVALRQNPEFRMRFADHVHRALFNDGPAAPGASYARYQELADEVELSIISESARWGDQARATPYTLADWEATRDYILDTYMPQRSAIVLNQMKAAGFYPNVTAPSFNLNGSYQHGGTINRGDSLTIGAPTGTIYYTTDGSDPRLLGGAISPDALTYSGAITLNDSTHVKSRVYSGGQWSALNEATFYIDLAPSIRITEIMYNPAAPTPAEEAAGHTDNNDFEFIEIKNISPTETLPLAGLRFSDGIEFTFPNVSIAPGEYMVVVKDQAAFNFRYDTFTGTIAGVYAGSLNNAGELVELDAPVGGIIHEFIYDDGWYDHTDGDGFSLTIRDPEGARELWNQEDGWRASAAPGGTPGYDDTLVTPGSIVISEVLAHSDDPFVDVIELHNAGDSPINLSGWFLSDQKTDDLGNEVLTKYQIPGIPLIGPGEYAVLYEDSHFGAAFSLSELGDDLYLSSNAGGIAGGYREHVDFGASPGNVSIGLHTKSTGGTDFTLLSAHSFGSDNAYPYLEDLVINEVMYHPPAPTADEVAAGFVNDEDFEFVEIYNNSPTATYPLTDYYVGDGIGFSFGWYNADSFGNEAWTLEPGATAAWDATLPPVLDTYEVFARWDLLDAEGNQRELDGRARYLVTHAGGSAVVIRDQEPEDDDEGPGYMDPEGWVSLGTYDFDGSGRVVLTRGTDNAGNWTIADQVKFVSATHEEVVDDPTLDSWYTSHGPAAIGPGGYVVIVNDYDAFDGRYDVAGKSIPVAGEYTANLNNGGEKVKLLREGAAEPNGFIPYYRIDYVNYDDVAPWPTEPDGQGPAMNRIDATQYGNDPINWEASGFGGTPGLPNVPIDRTPPSVPTGLTAHATVNPDTISLTWDSSVDNQSYVDHYVVYRDGEFLGQVPFLDPAYDDTDVLPATTYAYQVLAVNRDGYESDLSAFVVVAIPGIVTFSIPDANHVEITFSELLDPATAEVLDNYVFTGGTLIAVSLNGATVTLTTTELVIGNYYTVTVNNVTTLSGNEMSDGQQITFQYVPQGEGYILREYWTGIDGASINDLINSPNYPDNPTGVTHPTSLEGPVDWADDYGTRIQGYVHPPTSGNYTFWVSGDDNSALYLSTDANPDNAVQIASVPGWTNPRVWDTYPDDQKSVPIPLVAGLRYYIEVLHKEDGGGDNIAVRWQLPDGSWENPADPNEPIPGIRLSPYVGDSEPPTANIIDVFPDPRTTPVDQIDVVFSEAITGLGLSDFSLTRDGGGNLLTGAASLATNNNVAWTLGGLAAATEDGGTYTLTLRAAGSGVMDAVGNLMVLDASDTWVNNLVGPMVDVLDVSPDPRNSAVSQIQIVFDEVVTGFDVGDLSLTRDGGPNLLDGTESLTSGDGVTWTLGGLAALTGAAGTYTLTLAAAGSGIENTAHEPLIMDASDTWITDTMAPTANFLAVDPDPRDSAVDEIDIVFSEPVVGLNSSDFSLTRDGGVNLLSGIEPLSTTDNITWTLGGLAALTGTGTGASGFVAFNDHVPGAGTYSNTTTYSAMAGQVSTGPLKDITSGQQTGVTLTVTEAGVNFGGAQANPAPGTDAYEIFNGYVDLSGNGDGASIEIDGSDHYTYTFSGLSPGGASYNFHGTAIRGESSYADRWTKVTLVGADWATAAHSDGIGVVVLSDTEVALWTGYNSAADQGFVAGWTNIDPGPDGEFAVVSGQYKGPTPGVGTGDCSGGSKGYGIGGIRLEEMAPSGFPGTYTLTLTAAGSGVRDAAANPLAEDVSDTWVISSNPDLLTADIVDVSPDPCTSPVDQIEIVFSQPVSGLDLSDLSLTRDGGGNLLTGSESLQSMDFLTWTLGGLQDLTATSGTYVLSLLAAESDIADGVGNPLLGDASETWSVVITGRVVARHVFYNHSAFDGESSSADARDDHAIATDKEALLPGGTATFANYTSYSRGINAVMIDIDGMPAFAVPTVDDFQFRVGNSDTPGSWAAAPGPSLIAVRPGAGVDGSDRVTILWPDNAIQKQWLQVTVLTTNTTRLPEDDVFYFGNAIGDSGNSVTDAKVNATDMLAARNNQRTFIDPAPVDFDFDFDRDARVNATDMLIARNNQTNFLTALNLIHVPGGKAVERESQGIEREPQGRQPSLGKWDWLFEFEPIARDLQPRKGTLMAEQVVDKLLAFPV